MMLNKYNVGNTVIDRGQFPLQGLVEPDVAEILGKRKLYLDVVYIIFMIKFMVKFSFSP